MDDIVSPELSQGKYYVYELAYPESMGGDVFYVGKGQPYKDTEDRIDDHEKQALGQRTACNSRKIAIIQSILARGERVAKRKVAFFNDERDALMYEWALIHMTCYTDKLTNISTKGPDRPIKEIPELPYIEKPVCVRHISTVIHQVKDAEQFVSYYAIRRSSMLKLLQTGSIGDWRIIDCQCAIK